MFPYEEGFVEEVAEPLGEVLDEAVGVAEHVQPQDEHVGLLQRLLGVVGLDLGHHLAQGQDRTLLLEKRHPVEEGKEGKVLFNDIFNTFYLWLYGRKERRKEKFYLMTYSTHFIYGYMASDIYGKGPLR